MQNPIDVQPAVLASTGEVFPTLLDAIGTAARRVLTDGDLVFLVTDERGALLARVEDRKRRSITWPKVRRYNEGVPGPWRDVSIAALALGTSWDGV
jgi:hypothetical protein